MDEKQILRIAMKGIRPMMERAIRIDGTVDIGRMVKAEKDNVIAGCGVRHACRQVRPDEYREAVLLADSLEPVLEKMSRELEMKCRKDLKVRFIREASAKAIVSGLLEDAGYHGFTFVCQKHRIKVMVPVGTNTILIPLPYSKITKLVDEIVPAVKDAERMCAAFGRDFRIG